MLGWGLTRQLAVLTLSCAVLASTGTPARADHEPEGCRAEFWLSHQGGWEEYRPTARVSNSFQVAHLPRDLRLLTFAQALARPARTTGPERILLRSAVTAYLNAAHEGIAYPYRRWQQPYHLRETVNDALASRNRGYMRTVTADLDWANNTNRCPLL
jgi:hypothetical protein